jgi:YceI-like domain
MNNQRHVVLSVGIILSLGLVIGCGKSEDPAPARVAPPTTASVAPAAKPATSTAAAAVATTVKSFSVADAGSATFLIDAPLEKIKGQATHFRGNIEIDPAKLSATRGQVDVDLKTLKTSTFDDAEKNTKQTEHAQNWFELGNDVDAKQREENQWARFTIKSVKSSGPDNVAEIKETDGVRTVEVTAEGDLWLHGATVAKTVKLLISFKGTPDAPTNVQIKTVEPIAVSLEGHSVKPRDVAGKFLQGTLEKIGKKIDDKVQVSLDFTATPKKS